MASFTTNNNNNSKARIVIVSVLVLCAVACSSGAPATSSKEESTKVATKSPVKSGRQQKSLGYYDYLPQEIEDYAVSSDQDDYVSLDLENDISRAIPNRRRRPSQSANYNSPIYYIRLPPNPYMFVPGLGYVSQPPPPPQLSQVSPFVNLPLNFVSNGKPNMIYQWGSAMDAFTTQAPPTPPPKPKPSNPSYLPDSTIHRLPGQFQFNGKPNDIYVLRDSYNALYSDALQNFYP